MNLDEIRTYLGGDWTQTQERIRLSLRSDIDLLNTTNSSILAHNGKQLRPLLSLLIARACNGGRATELTYDYAAAVELLHNATLLHDDVADNSDERRGNPTVRSILGPSAAVLVGDYWLVKAMECILDADNDSRVTHEFAATLRHLAEGEMFQLQKAESADTCEADYYRIIKDKTASMFRTAAFASAVSVDATPEAADAMCTFAEKLGLAFQIKDDIFDYTPEAEVGKPIGADILERKITLPLLGALSNVDAGEQEHIRHAVANISENPGEREGIIRFVRENGGIEYAARQMDMLLEEAVSALDVLQESRDKEYLILLARFVGERTV